MGSRNMRALMMISITVPFSPCTAVRFGFGFAGLLPPNRWAFCTQTKALLPPKP